MQVAMTERDKKLIVMLAIIVIVVSIGYWGIRPAIQAMILANEEIIEQEELKELNDMKIAQIPILQDRTEQYEADVEELKKEYLPYMNSDEIDKMFTGMVLERGLFAYDLDINIESTPASLQPYSFSKMATDPFYEPSYEEETEDEDLNTQSGMMNALDEELNSSAGNETIEENFNDVVYRAHLVLRIGGDLDKLFKFVDDMEAYEKKILITGYRWNESTYISRDDNGEENLYDKIVMEEDNTENTEETVVAEEAATEEGESNITVTEGNDGEGSYDIVSERILTLELDVFMYKDVAE